MQEEILLVVVCKPMWQNTRAYQTSIEIPSPHNNAELLLVFTQYSFSGNSQIECFRTHVDVDIFLVCYVELVPKVCPHLSHSVYEYVRAKRNSGLITAVNEHQS
jgi:hypothetical protein